MEEEQLGITSFSEGFEACRNWKGSKRERKTNTAAFYNGSASLPSELFDSHLLDHVSYGWL